jgi:hypothetical protein
MKFFRAESADNFSVRHFFLSQEEKRRRPRSIEKFSLWFPKIRIR